MDKQILTVEKRTITGRKVKQLRKKDILPASLYGKKVKSEALQMPRKEFEAVYAVTGETGIIDLSGLGQTRPVLVKTVQVHPVTLLILHVDFHQVDLTEKVKSNIPVEVVGEAQAVADKKGVLLNVLDSVEVEALPTDLPEKITVDVVSLSEPGDVIKVAQLSVPSSVTVLTDEELEIVKIGELVTKEAQSQAKADEEAAAEQAAESADEAKEGDEAASGDDSGEPKEDSEKSTSDEQKEKSAKGDKKPDSGKDQTSPAGRQESEEPAKGAKEQKGEKQEKKESKK